MNTRSEFSNVATLPTSGVVSAERARPTKEQALAGITPYAVGTFFTASYIEDAQHRLSRYNLAWKFYNGEQHEIESEDGEPKLVVNYTKRVADTSNNWLRGNGWSMQGVSGNETVAELLTNVWEDNNKELLFEQMALHGSVTGDCFVYIGVKTMGDDGTLLPREEWSVKLTAVNPSFCFPKWNSLTGAMESIAIQIPLLKEGEVSFKIMTLIIDSKEWLLYEDDELKSSKPNPFGMINVVHIPNTIAGTGCYGHSEIADIVPLNEEYNEVCNRIRKIIKYHAEPTTLAFGVRLGDMERGSSKLWSNLPKDARIENLKLDADLTEIRTYAQLILSHLKELACMPQVVFDADESSLSNTSGLAMQMKFQPLIERVMKRRVTYARGIGAINRVIIAAYENILSIQLSAVADFPQLMHKTKVLFTLPLPKDEKSELDAAQMRLNMGIWSKAEAMRRCSSTADFTRLVLEIMADERAKLANQYETQRANTGLQPNLSAPFLGSAVLSEDMEAVAEETKKVEDPEEVDPGKNDQIVLTDAGKSG